MVHVLRICFANTWYLQYRILGKNMYAYMNKVGDINLCINGSFIIVCHIQ